MNGPSKLQRYEWSRRHFLAASAALGLSPWTALSAAESHRSVDRVVRLPDGRCIGTRRHGDPDHGSPVLHFHGAPSSRIETDVIAQLAHAAGVYLIGVDRPGFGISSYKSNHTVANYPDDIRALIAALRAERGDRGTPIGKVGILSLSSGTPFALACAEKLPDDISAVALTSSRALCAPGVPFGSRDNLLMWSLKRPQIADFQLRLITRSLVRSPERGIRKYSSKASAPDQAFANSHVSFMVRCVTESIRCGTAGLFRDMALQSWPWGLCLENIQVPVRARHGSCDTTSPAQSLTFLANRVAGGAMREEFRLVAGHGHLSIFTHQAGELLDWLRSCNEASS